MFNIANGWVGLLEHQNKWVDDFHAQLNHMNVEAHVINDSIDKKSMFA
jgi:hypothetical protein